MSRVSRALSCSHPATSCAGITLGALGPRLVSETIRSDEVLLNAYHRFLLDGMSERVFTASGETAEDDVDTYIHKIADNLTCEFNVTSADEWGCRVVIVTGRESLTIPDGYTVVAIFSMDSFTLIHNGDICEFWFISQRKKKMWVQNNDIINADVTGAISIEGSVVVLLRVDGVQEEAAGGEEEEEKIPLEHEPVPLLKPGAVDEEEEEEREEGEGYMVEHVATRTVQPRIDQMLGDEVERRARNEPEVDIMLDQVTMTNRLYREYRDVICDSFNEGGLHAIIAPTGSGKTRLGMIQAVMAALENIKNEEGRRHLVIIACPYRVIAANFFMKLSSIQCSSYSAGVLTPVRPLLGKLLISDNVEGNKPNMWIKKAVCARYSGKTVQQFEDCFSDVYKEDGKNGIRIKNKMLVDFVVGSYEMIEIFMDSANILSEVINEKLTVHAVFDEFQEAFKSRERRFCTAATVFDKLAHASKSFLIISGSYSLLDTSNGNDMERIITTQFDKVTGTETTVEDGKAKKVAKLEKRSFSLHKVKTAPKVVHRITNSSDNRIVNTLCTAASVLEVDSNGIPTSGYETKFNYFMSTLPFFFHIADSLAHPGKGCTIVMLNDKAAAEGIMDAALACLACIQKEHVRRGGDIKEWALPVYTRDMLVNGDPYRTNMKGKHILSKFTKFGDLRIRTVDRIMQMAAQIEEINRSSRDSVERKAKTDPLYKEKRALEASIEDFQPRHILGSPRVFNKLYYDTRKASSINTQTTAFTEDTMKEVTKTKYSVTCYKVCDSWVRMNEDMFPELKKGEYPWDRPVDSRKLEESALFEFDVKTMADVKILSTMALMLVNNASEDYTTALEDELQAVRQSPRVWVATQKIGIGADLPHVRRVITLSGRYHSLTNELTDQVLGRCDRERMGRLYMSEEILGRYTSSSKNVEKYMSTDNAVYIAGYYMLGNKVGPISQYFNKDGNRYRIMTKEVSWRFIKCVDGIMVTGRAHGANTHATDMYIKVTTKDDAGVVTERGVDTVGVVHKPWAMVDNFRELVGNIIGSDAYKGDFVFTRELRNIFDAEHVGALPYAEAEDTEIIKHVIVNGRQIGVPCTAALVANYYNTSYRNNRLVNLIASGCITKEIQVTNIYALRAVCDACGITDTVDPVSVVCNSGFIVKSQVIKAVDDTIKQLSFEQCISLFIAITDILRSRRTVYDRNDSSGKKMLEFKFAMDLLNKGTASDGFEDPFSGIRGQANIDSTTQWFVYAEAAMFIIQPYVLIESTKTGYKHWIGVEEGRVTAVAAKISYVINFLRGATFYNMNNTSGSRQLRGDSARSTAVRVMEDAVNIASAAKRMMEADGAKPPKIVMEQLQGTCNMKMIFIIKLAARLAPKFKIVMKKLYGNDNKNKAMAEFFEDERFTQQPIFNAWYNRSLLAVGKDVMIDSSWCN